MKYLLKISDGGRYYVINDGDKYRFIGFGRVFYQQKEDDERTREEFISDTAQEFLDECGLGQVVDTVRKMR